MRKRILEKAQQGDRDDADWLDLERLAEVEITSEDPDHPIESALLPASGDGWRAAQSGEQTIRLIFPQPQHIRRICLQFVEPCAQRKQQFVLRWSEDGSSFREIVSQQWNFSPPGATGRSFAGSTPVFGFWVDRLDFFGGRAKSDVATTLKIFKLNAPKYKNLYFGEDGE